MSWKERLENIKFKITTGDGKTFTPLWRTGEKSKEFNISKYDFINLENSLIDRKKPQSNLYPLTFYFQGEDNIEQANAFEISANDSRFWTIEHPFYGTIKGQPTNLKRNDDFYNVTEVTVDFWESISGDFPESEISVNDEVRARVNSVNQLSAAFFVENSQPATADIDTIKNNVTLMSSKFKPDAASFNDYQNLVKKALVSADNLVTNTSTAFTDVQQAINAPAEFATFALTKINSYVDAYNVLKQSIGNLFSKYNFESQSANLISSVCIACINPLEDEYITRNDIESVNATLISLYEDYLETLDNNQVSIYDIENNWSPSVQIQSALMDLVFYTSASLFLLGFNARQERTVELTQDTNLILLTHKYLGLDAQDRNIEIFRKRNNIKNNELYKIRQGRTIKYFV